MRPQKPVLNKLLINLILSSTRWKIPYLLDTKGCTTYLSPKVIKNGLKISKFGENRPDSMNPSHFLSIKCGE